MNFDLDGSGATPIPRSGEADFIDRGFVLRPLMRSEVGRDGDQGSVGRLVLLLVPWGRGSSKAETRDGTVHRVGRQIRHVIPGP